MTKDIAKEKITPALLFAEAMVRDSTATMIALCKVARRCRACGKKLEATGPADAERCIGCHIRHLDRLV